MLRWFLILFKIKDPDRCICGHPKSIHLQIPNVGQMCTSMDYCNNFEAEI